MIVWLLACNPAKDTGEADAARGALGQGVLNPFPSMEVVGDDGRLAFPDGLLPIADGGTEWDVSRLNWRDGFSVVQPSVAMLPVPIDPESLSGEDGIGIGGSVRMLDLDSGEEIPAFAELDAYPDAVESGERTLIVRPMAAMTVGHRVAVAVTDAVTSGGAPLSLPEWDDAKARDSHYADLEAQLGDLGVDHVALAWDFPVGDGTTPLRTLAAAVSVPPAYTFTRVMDADTAPAGNLPDGVWKKIEGTFTADNWLVGDQVFSIDGDGAPAPQGTAEAYLYIHVPEAVRGAAPGTVPVVVFGHGFLEDPAHYLNDADDASAVIALSNRMGAIFVATVWRGLTRDDVPDALTVAGDFGSFPALSDRLTQGVANNLSLIRLLSEGSLLDDPELGGLPDRTHIYWYGISLGSIEGAVTLANQSTIDLGVLHVGGSDWSTMLERSSNWPPFEYVVTRSVPDPADRQLLYAVSQLLWDPVDPADYTEDLRGRTLLWQESMGDNQVPNLATELLMRSAGVPLGQPSVTTPYGIDTVALPTLAPAFTQFDPELGYPAEGNRPAEATGAHDVPRTFPGCISQTTAFFSPIDPGRVNHYCGSEPCSVSNPGE